MNVALASVIVSGVAVITTGATGIGIAVWSARQNAKLAREQRTQQRLADSYLEVLRIVERVGQWVEAEITYKSRIADDEFIAYERVMVPAPAVTDRSTAKAHLAAFGSPNVCRLYDAWRPIMDEIEDENEKLEFMAKDGQEPSPGELAHLQDALRRQERPARQALADAIASELPHQITATTGNGNTTTASCDNTQ